MRIQAMAAKLQDYDATSWISPDGRHYVVPGRYGREAAVDVDDGGPSNWYCSCEHDHEAETFCDPILQVALLRGDFTRRKVI
ncbi:MAG TPA: hypothetical protein VM286_07150 [Candidatus Thermoplasmatota archaeon]|nr:hypothetical protein [Candidatus Thermoplasmatota archaeon]